MELYDLQCIEKPRSFLFNEVSYRVIQHSDTVCMAIPNDTVVCNHHSYYINGVLLIVFTLDHSLDDLMI